MRSNLKYIIVLVSLLVLAVVIELFSPEPLDWTENFSKKRKIPYGSFVLSEILSDIFPGMEIVDSYDPAHESLLNTGTGKNYILISSSFAPEKKEAEALLHFIKKGNTAFIAARIFQGKFADEFKLKTGFKPFSPSSSGVNFVNRKLKAIKDYTFSRMSSCFYFTSFRKQRALLLGKDSEGRANLLKIRYGRGSVVLSTLPLAFTNYNLVDEKNYTYVCRALSYLPVKPVIWDEYYKPNRVTPGTPLRYILSSLPLSMAYYLLLSLLLLFVIFRAKRKQRIIPVVPSLPNTSRDFIETVGRLYYQEKDHANIFEKKKLYFFEYIRTSCHLDKIIYSDDFNKILSERSGVSFLTVKELFDFMSYLNSKKQINEEDLMKVNSYIEKFFSETVG